MSNSTTERAHLAVERASACGPHLKQIGLSPNRVTSEMEGYWTEWTEKDEKHQMFISLQLSDSSVGHPVRGGYGTLKLCQSSTEVGAISQRNSRC